MSNTEQQLPEMAGSFMPSDSFLQCYHSSNLYKKTFAPVLFPFALVVSGRIYDLEYSKYVLMIVLNQTSI